MKNNWKIHNLLFVILCLSFVCFIDIQNANSFTFLIKPVGKLGREAIVKLAKLGKTSSSKEVASEVAKYSKDMSPVARRAFHEKAYSQILVAQGRLDSKQADDIIKNLSGVPGFEKALRKMVGKSDSKAVGHGYEVLTANELHKKGFTIKELGKSFSDGVKSHVSDIDLIAEKQGKTFIFELKNYDPGNITSATLEKFRADMVTLNSYEKLNPGAKQCFVMQNMPYNKGQYKKLNDFAKRHNVLLIFGDSRTVSSILDAMK